MWCFYRFKWAPSRFYTDTRAFEPQCIASATHLRPLSIFIFKILFLCTTRYRIYLSLQFALFRINKYVLIVEISANISQSRCPPSYIGRGTSNATKVSSISHPSPSAQHPDLSKSGDLPTILRVSSNLLLIFPQTSNSPYTGWTLAMHWLMVWPSRYFKNVEIRCHFPLQYS